MTVPETLTMTIDGGPPEVFRYLVPVWVSACPIEGGFIWMAWGLN